MKDFADTAIQTQSSYASNTDLDTEAGFDTASTLDDILDFTEEIHSEMRTQHNVRQ